MSTKKLLILNILDILKDRTDEGHTLTQQELIKILQAEYGMKPDRKSVKRALMELVDCGYEVEHRTETRITPNKKGVMEESEYHTDYYLNREFTDAELRLLIDSLLFSKHIPYSQCKELIEKIEGLSNRFFKSKVKHICNLPADMPENKELFYTIEILDEAIESGLQVEFSYGDYGTDKKLHPRLDSEGKPRRYLVNPYQMAATNGRYYLIGNYDKYDNISHYRLDRIQNIRLLGSKVKPQRKVAGMEYGLDLPKHMAQHVYMFSGPAEHVTLRADKGLAGDLIDWFGADVEFLSETDTTLTAHVKVSSRAMKHWAMQYAPYVTILSPQSLVDEIKADMQEALERYK